MSAVVTLAERHRRKMDGMRRSIAELDVLLSDYARRNGGRFIRYGSTATGRMMAHSDVDIIADFPEQLAGPAATFAEQLCADHGLKPDLRPVLYVSDKLLARALAEGVVLS